MLPSHGVMGALSSAFLNLFLRDAGLAVYGETEAETQATERKSAEKYCWGKKWNVSYKMRGLLLFLPNTYVDVISLSMPAT